MDTGDLQIPTAPLLNDFYRVEPVVQEAYPQAEASVAEEGAAEEGAAGVGGDEQQLEPQCKYGDMIPHAAAL